MLRGERNCCIYESMFIENFLPIILDLNYRCLQLLHKSDIFNIIYI